MKPYRNNLLDARIKPLPFACYCVPMVLITVSGMVASAYLALSHYRVHTDPYHSSFCAISRAFNCDTVSSSSYAVMLNLPMAVWGMIGYALALIILVAATRRKADKTRGWPTIFWLSLLYSGGSILLAGVSAFLIHSYCIVCMFTYLVNFSLLYYAWFVNRRFGDAGLIIGAVQDLRVAWRHRQVTLAVAAVFILLTGGLMAATPPYWQMEAPHLSDDVPRGVTDEGYPWIGAENPTLTIHEFSDYMCFQCKKMHFFLRELIRLYPNEIRLVHRHFPMDHAYNPLVKEPFHTGSGKMALIALVAQQKGRFWEVNDYLYDLATQKRDFNTKTIASQLGISNRALVDAVSQRYFRLRLKHDIAMGIAKGITGTPGYLIGDKVYEANIPADILQQYIK